MALVHKSRQTYIDAVLDIIGNEVVVSLKDKSAHSIVMRDGVDAERLAAYLQSVLEGAHRVVVAEASGDAVYMEKTA
ncbi:MAG: hypothetical protein J4G04_05380 [Nitrosopumilaceae archaeon]|nr:hypothetical protein [Nitrosopumilaceae archaeon]